MKDKWVFVLTASLVTLIFLTFYFFYPLLDGIVMGIVFAYVAKPVKKRIERKTGSLASSLISTLVIIVPISFLMFYGIFQGVNQLIYLLSHQSEVESSFIGALRDAGIDEKYIQQVEELIPTLVSIAQSKLKLSALDATVKAVMFFMNFIISIIVCFYVLLDADKFIESLLKVLPEERREEFGRFVKEVDEIFLGLWFGNFVVAMLIGIASVPFFLFFNIPYTPLLSGLMFLAALIPVFAEWMVLAPVALFLALKDVWTAVWFIVIGFVFLYFLPEVILRPYFVGYASKIHPLVLMLAFIGGAIIGGVSGFFIAPMLAGLITAVYNHYTK
jgi:predicted PurR-regulated permease PerM